MFKTIVLDPNWPERGGGKCKRGADRHYEVKKPHEIIEIIYTSGVWLPDTSGCHVYMWVTNNWLEKGGLFVMNALGVRYVTNLSWPKPHFGLGQYFRGQHEICLFGVIGRCGGSVRDESTLIHGDKRGRSKKPEDVFRKAERVSKAPRLEMFATEYRAGWVGWGKPSVDSEVGIIKEDGSVFPFSMSKPPISLSSCSSGIDLYGFAARENL